MYVGSFSPAAQLDAFVVDMRLALSSVISLELHLEDTGGGAVDAAALDESMALFMEACPSSTYFSSQGQSTAFFNRLGKACPSLSSLTLISTDLTYVQNVMLQLPSLLPNVQFLDLQGDEFQLPDMSANTGIVDLRLTEFQFCSASEWRCLPPKLQSLECEGFYVGPPTLSDGSPLLDSLLSLEVCTYKVSLTSLVKLLRAAPKLHTFETLDTLDIIFSLSPATAADLSTLHQRPDLSTITYATYCVSCRVDAGGVSVLPAFATLPCMTGITSCQWKNCGPAALHLLMQAFPDLTELFLHTDLIDNVQLQELRKFPNLTALKLMECAHISPIGVLALYEHHPLLRGIECVQCPLITQQELQGCVQLLEKYGKFVEIVELFP